MFKVSYLIESSHLYKTALSYSICPVSQEDNWAERSDWEAGPSWPGGHAAGPRGNSSSAALVLMPVGRVVRSAKSVSTEPTPLFWQKCLLLLIKRMLVIEKQM